MVTFKFNSLDNDENSAKGGMKGGMKVGMKSGMKTYPNLSYSLEQIINIIEKQPTISIVAIATRLGKAKSGVQKQIRQLQDMGMIRRVGPDKGGHWEVVKN